MVSTLNSPYKLMGCMRDHGISTHKERRKKLHRHGAFNGTFLENPNDMIALKKQHFQKRMELFGKKIHKLPN